jgi:acetyl esterase/lipase
LGAYLAESGIAVLAISYKLVNHEAHTRFPAQMKDLNAALHYCTDNAISLGIDGNRIGLIGDSAGAHLAALLALGVHKDPDLPAIRAMVGVYGVYDLIAQFEYDLVNRTSDPITEKLLGISALDDRRAYFEASPLSYAVRGVNRPAFLIGWGTNDDIVDYASQSVAFLRALKRAGFVTRSLPVIGAPHFWIEEPLEEAGSYAALAAPKIRQFLKTFL